MQIQTADVHLMLDGGQLVTLLSLLWKASQLTQKVNLMWQVFAREHGLESNGTPKRGKGAHV